MGPNQLILHVSLSQDLQPHRRDHVELGTEGLGNVVAMVVPLEK